MAYIIKSFSPVTNSNKAVQYLSCMPNRICKNKIHDAAKIQENIEKAAKAKQMLEKENAHRNDIIKESAVAKAYLGLK